MVWSVQLLGNRAAALEVMMELLAEQIRAVENGKAVLVTVQYTSGLSARTPVDGMRTRRGGARAMRQGKCLRCKSAFYWKYPRPVGKARCPDCGRWLRRTSRQLRKFRWIELIWL